MNERQKRGKANPVAVALSALMALITVVVLLMFGQSQGPKEFMLGDCSGADIAALEEKYALTDGEDDLVALLNALCYKAEVEGDEAAGEKIAAYGTQLLDRARAGRTDLQKLEGDEALALELMRLIRAYGAS